MLERNTLEYKRPGSYERLKDYVPANFEPEPIVVEAESDASRCNDVPRKN